MVKILQDIKRFISRNKEGVELSLIKDVEFCEKCGFHRTITSKHWEADLCPNCKSIILLPTSKEMLELIQAANRKGIRITGWTDVPYPTIYFSHDAFKRLECKGKHLKEMHDEIEVNRERFYFRYTGEEGWERLIHYMKYFIDTTGYQYRTSDNSMVWYCEKCHRLSPPVYMGDISNAFHTDEGRKCPSCGEYMVGLDLEISDLIKILNSKGYKTKNSCDGHSYFNSTLYNVIITDEEYAESECSPYIMFEKESFDDFIKQFKFSEELFILDH